MFVNANQNGRVGRHSLSYNENMCRKTALPYNNINQYLEEDDDRQFYFFMKQQMQ